VQDAGRGPAPTSYDVRKRRECYFRLDDDEGMDLDHEACYRALRTRDARFDGRFFVAVRTTGIYCRPICPARTPKCENIRFYPSAAAAQEAGFRPCLRCRPENSPDFACWNGTSTTVSRALALIGGGALDDSAVDGLAERLGVGERQLRRLFQQHLGISPLAIAQTRRVLFAKRLIADTRMPLAEVAFASGFGSVRRFNTIFHRLYRRPPRELRRSHVKSHGEAPAAAGISITLPFAQPYDWNAILAFLAARAIPGVEKVENNCYRRTIALDGFRGTIAVELDARGTALRASIQFPNVAALSTIAGRLRRVFDLGADPIAIGTHLAADPRLAPLVAARPGLRVPGAWDGFELAVRAMLGQQITVGAATKLAGKLVAAHGETFSDGSGSDESGLTHVFPSPAKLAGEDLRKLGMPASRAWALSSLAAAFAADTRLLDHLERGLDDAITHLRRLTGIGEWTAQYIAMRALREPDAFPASDIGLLRAMAGSGGIRPSPAELLATAERWRPWRAYAALHLWVSNANIPA
jgi:AraC family transcriptional regulator of adaptative response / DNA-3-methyladenine glycosylase II